MESKTTSKTSSLKALLLKAWRERWNDLQWGINIKTVLPRGVSGDVYDLADCILQQAVIGSGANQLVLSYLKHSLSSQLVSYAAVLQRISKYEHFDKPHCMSSLLDFLESIQSGITCRTKSEENTLASALLNVVHWLLNVLQHNLNHSSQNANFFNQNELLEKPCNILAAFIKCDFIVSMLYLAKYDNPSVYSTTQKMCRDVDILIKSSTAFKPPVQMDIILHKLSTLEIDSIFVNTEKVEPITYCIQSLLVIEVLLNPCSETKAIVAQLLMIKRIKGYSNPRLYCELVRACLISFNDGSGSSKESQWGAFTILKVPQVLKQLVDINKSADDNTEFSQDIVDAFEMLLQYTPLLDVTDISCSCNCLECLLTELIKVKLVTEKHVKYFSSKREGISTSLQKLDQTNTQTASMPKVIIRAEPTLAGILRTLNADYGKTQEALLGMLYQVLTGKSFELILAVATVQGKLKTFVTKLIKFNELSKQGDVGKSHTRSMFDISFLMLCSIVQTYGSKVVLEENGDSFFEQWVKSCMVEKDAPKSPDQMLKLCDQSKIDILLQQFSNQDSGDFKNGQIKWHEVCMNISGVIMEVLFAWEHESITANDVKRILDTMRSRACSLGVCASAWLCAHVRLAQHDAILKPMNMIQHFLTPLSEEQENFKDRHSLMSQIIRRMQYGINPPCLPKNKSMTLSMNVVSTVPISEQLQTIWTNIQSKCWVNIDSTYALESLLNTGGPKWFVGTIVKEILKLKYIKDLDKAVDIAFAVFHLDIEKCTVALILQVLPIYLYNNIQSENLIEPQSSTLAKLCVYCIVATIEYNNYCPSSTSKKRSRQVEKEECDSPASKLLRLNDNTQETISNIFGSSSKNSANLQPISTSKSTLVLRDPLNSALQELFQTFVSLVSKDGYICTETYFIFEFLKCCVLYGRDLASVILQSMPNSLVPNLLKCLPDLFTSELLLRLYDISNNTGTASSRSCLARDLCMLRNILLRHSK